MRAAWRLWLATVFLAGCAGPSELARSTGSPLGVNRLLLASRPAVRTSSPDDDEPAGPMLGAVTERERESECRLAAAQLARILAPVDRVGAEVELTYWADQGALTLLSWRRVEEGRERASPADFERLQRDLVRWLRSYVGERPGALRLLYRRTPGGWALSVSVQDDVRRPREAKTLPVDAPEISAGAFAAIESTVRSRWVPLLVGPARGSARVEFRADFEDDRWVDSALLRSDKTGEGPLVAAPPWFDTQLAGALVAFTQGVGRRSVRVVVEAVPIPGDERPGWRVSLAETIRPREGEPEDPWSSFTEYRLLHEEILRHSREEVHGAAVYAASFSAEQLAWWVAGAWAVRGMGALVEVMAGPVSRVLGRGGPEAGEWLYCQLRRVTPDEREVFAQLLAKLEAQGEKALAATEKAQMKAFLERLDKLAKTPLETEEKKRFRAIAGERFWRHLKMSNPQRWSTLGRSKELYEVHHRLALEYAHLAPTTDVNSVKNLVAVEIGVHDSIDRVWRTLRPLREKATLAEVQEVVEIVDRHYGSWYNSETIEMRREELNRAEEAAMSEIEAILNKIRSRP